MLDRLMSFYRIKAKTRKWTVRMIMHFFDFAICAGWVEYRRHQTALGTPKRDILDCLSFRMKYEEFLSYTEPETSTDEDDPNFEHIPSVSKRSRTRVPHPPDALRKKHVLHLPEFSESKQKNRCRLPGCGSNTARICCSTCKVFLCVLPKRNCFKLYHEL